MPLGCENNNNNKHQGTQAWLHGSRIVRHAYHELNTSQPEFHTLELHYHAMIRSIVWLLAVEDMGTVTLVY
jgi:hypothetical protein